MFWNLLIERMKLLHIYILEESHRQWFFISSSFFLSQDFLPFPNYLFTIDINFGIYQLRNDEIFKYIYIYIYIYWKEVIDDDLLSPPLSFFPLPKISFPFQVIYLRSTLKSLLINVLEFINWKDDLLSSPLSFFPRFPSTLKSRKRISINKFWNLSIDETFTYVYST